MLTQSKNKPIPVIQFAFFLLFLLMLVAPFDHPCQAEETYETDPNDEPFSIHVASGRVTNLTIGGETIEFGDETGGFYVRDYTLDPDTGLPENLDSNGNLLGCSTFEGSDAGEPECNDCLIGQGIWNFEENIPGNPEIFCQTLTINSVDTTVAELVLPRTLTTETYYLGIYQDINISDLYGNPPSTHDLFCFSFDLATACGFRPKRHPEGWDSSEVTKSTYGPHEIIGRIDWFETIDDLNGTDFIPSYAAGTDGRFASTEARVWETTNEMADPQQTYSHPEDMTSCGLRSYRPREANFVRVGVIIHGHVPNDGVPDTDDHAYFDNFAFYKAPERIPVRTQDLLEGTSYRYLRKDSDGSVLTPNLLMRATVEVFNGPGRDYLKIKGHIKNANLHPEILQPRALDLGFSFPIDGDDHTLVWWDDMRHSEDVYNSPNLLPFRMTGAIDIRPELKHDFPDYTNQVLGLRGEGTKVSVYPYSVLDIDISTEVRALSFGDDLDANCVPVSHFGFRVTEPVPKRGEYYTEFQLGVLEEGTVSAGEHDVDFTPFSFILFRSDDPEGATTSNFRIATDDYQTDIYSEHFTRPEPFSRYSTEKNWKYGGGFYQAKAIVNPDPPPEFILEDTTFNNNPEMYGLRYTQETYTGQRAGPIFRAGVDACNELGVSTLINCHPLNTRFVEPST